VQIGCSRDAHRSALRKRLGGKCCCVAVHAILMSGALLVEGFPPLVPQLGRITMAETVRQVSV
jgi:hypothetical protein